MPGAVVFRVGEVAAVSRGPVTRPRRPAQGCSQLDDSSVSETGTACGVSPLEVDSQDMAFGARRQSTNPYSVTGASVPAGVSAGPSQVPPDQAASAVDPPCGRKGQLRRNAVGDVGVRLVAAPDAPLRGEVLARAPVDQPHGSRRCAASTDIYLLRGFHVRPALAKGLDISEPRTGPSDTCRNAQVRDTRKRRALQSGGAWRAANAADNTRQRASVGRTCGRARTLGRTPSERNHRSVLRLIWRA
jgi:hypothetical protein